MLSIKLIITARSGHSKVKRRTGGGRGKGVGEGSNVSLTLPPPPPPDSSQTKQPGGAGGHTQGHMARGAGGVKRSLSKEGGGLLLPLRLMISKQNKPE